MLFLRTPTRTMRQVCEVVFLGPIDYGLGTDHAVRRWRDGDRPTRIGGPAASSFPERDLGFRGFRSLVSNQVLYLG
jgi:hypothetical protein